MAFSFGGTPAPSAATPAAGGGLFGSTTAPAPAPTTGGGLFGAPGKSLYPSLVLIMCNFVILIVLRWL